MAKVLSKTGVQTGQTIQAFHISQSVDAFTGLSAYNITISGGLTVNGYSFPTGDGIADQVMATDGSGNLTFQTLPLAATASFITSSGVKGPYGGDSITTASYAVSASHVEFADLASASYHAVNASDANTATSASYARTASVVTDTNVAFLDQNNIFTGTNQTFTNIIVNGTGSFAYFQSVTGSAKIIGDAFIILNNDTPSERYAGIKVYDSGSANTTASLEFDGLTNDWFYEYSDDGGATTDHGVVLFGPEYATKGSPTYPTNNRIVKGNGDHHIVDSSITDNGTTVSTSLPFTSTQITASSGFKGNLVGNVTGTATTASYVDWPNIDNKPALLSSSAQIASDISGAFTEASASFSTRVTALEDFSSSLDTNYVTEAELVAATASLSASLATDISTNKTDIDTLENKTLVSGSSQITLQSTTGDLSGSRVDGAVQTATSASYSVSASHAEFADNSRTSVSSSFAVSGSHSEFADSSRTSISSSFATSASHAEFADSTTSASYAISASHVEFSDNSRDSVSSSFALTASYALNAATADTGSLLVTASAVGTTVTFTKGDSTTFDIVISQTGSIASASFATSASHAEFSDNTRDAISSSYAVTASYAVSSSHEIIQEISSSFATSASHAEFADESSTSISSSFATTASYALNAGSGAVTETLEYNGQIRYEIVSGSTKAQIVSTGNVYKNLSWSRSSTTLTVTSTGHGLSTGDNILIRNMSEDYELKSITTSGSDAFTCTVADSGDTSGTTGAYIPAFDCSTISLTSGVVTVTAPGAGDLQLNSMMVYAPSSESDPITVNIPAGDSNSGGINSALDTRFPPLCTFYKLDGPNPILSSTTVITYSKTANFAQYSIGGGSPDTFGAVQFVLRF